MAKFREQAAEAKTAWEKMTEAEQTAAEAGYVKTHTAVAPAKPTKGGIHLWLWLSEVLYWWRGQRQHAWRREQEDDT